MPYLLDVWYFDLETHDGFFNREFSRFCEFMIGEGYFPLGSKVLFSQGKLHIVDFSHYGMICTNSKHSNPMMRKVVHMPKMKSVVPFCVLEESFTIPEKIETDTKTDA
jgi:CRISPR/Cas system-associated protein endoribonuclease Cas2